jgi:hypothetical protein
MKATFFALFFLVAASAFGQVSVLSNEISVFHVTEHPQHAEAHALAPELSLVGGGSVSYAQGERPLWEFGPVSAPPTPLGDVARAFRKEKLDFKKAEIVFEKQGS